MDLETSKARKVNKNTANSQVYCFEPWSILMEPNSIKTDHIGQDL